MRAVMAGTLVFIAIWSAFTLYYSPAQVEQRWRTRTSPHYHPRQAR